MLTLTTTENKIRKARLGREERKIQTYMILTEFIRKNWTNVILTGFIISFKKRSCCPTLLFYYASVTAELRHLKFYVVTIPVGPTENKVKQTIIHLIRKFCPWFQIVYYQEFESRCMSIERKSVWTVCIINECYVYCFSLRRSTNLGNDHCIWN